MAAKNYIVRSKYTLILGDFVLATGQEVEISSSHNYYGWLRDREQAGWVTFTEA